jgi:DnaK suppressor protein
MSGIAERPMTARTTTPTKQALNSRQRARLRGHLAGDREQTRLVIERTVGELDAFVSARYDAPTDDENDPEGPTLAFERSQASAMLRQSEQHLQDIDAALLRMDQGTYGLCITCGGEIALGRLQVRPQASLCIRCAEHVR